MFQVTGLFLIHAFHDGDWPVARRSKTWVMPTLQEMIMVALKLLAGIALSALVVVPVVMQDTIRPLVVVTMHAPDVDAHAMWGRWPQ